MMGSTFSHSAEYLEQKKSYEPLYFHSKARGSQILLNDCYSRAERLSTFHDGIVFTNRPVQPCERVTLRILKMEDGWNGGLRVGFSCLNPSNINPFSLPPFICPDLVAQSPTWAAVLPDRFIKVGDIIHFWVNKSGKVFLRTNELQKFLLFDKVTVSSPLWAVMDVYGTTKAVELLTPVSKPFCLKLGTQMFRDEPHEFRFCSPASDEEECCVCLHHAKNTWLLPCGHTILCYCCAKRLFRDTAKCPMCRCKIEQFYLQNQSTPADTPQTLPQCGPGCFEAGAARSVYL
ncbi:E3 ubiquitin-protein ligase NEURL3-like [Dromiciops gliroides]|uniref:E3 ubiquitin-protein ligase NEURL3-like n=1 Tax=Dromiciops gliroides TaxID=33562 RepID=UPI001CC56B79|nr:E3 ubiquitin-protein ligase NEURL3-like [Dromiciops gliroides]